MGLKEQEAAQRSLSGLAQRKGRSKEVVVAEQRLSLRLSGLEQRAC